jgi:hypothetical protein
MLGTLRANGWPRVSPVAAFFRSDKRVHDVKTWRPLPQGPSAAG